MKKQLRVGIIGCGTIGKYVLDSVMAGKIDNAEVAVVCGRTNHSKGREDVHNYGIRWVTDFNEMMKCSMDVIVEAASHEAIERYGVSILKSGIDLIPASLGALVDQALLQTLKASAEASGSIIHIPSGGIGGLDALQAAVEEGVDTVTMTSRKPPVAWKNIPVVDRMNLDLDHMETPTVLFKGPARDCVKEFPQNINIAAALSLAGIGFDKTHIRILADPTVIRNTHEIECEGRAGKFKIVLENVPDPDNPKTTRMACYSVLAALKNIRSHYRVGT
jgi:aspartate dehydrogenase